MDRIGEQTKVALPGLIDKLQTHETIRIRRSKDTLIRHFTQAMAVTAQDGSMVTRRLIFFKGLSQSGIRMLQEALRVCSTIEELEFSCIDSLRNLQGAMHCCFDCSNEFPSSAKIKKLSLKELHPRAHHGMVSIATAISNTLLNPQEDVSKVVSLQELVISKYPIGAVGMQVISMAMGQNTRLKSLALRACDLRSDSTFFLVNMIRDNRHLQELDLSYNQGVAIFHQMPMVETIVRHGLQHNINLTQLHTILRQNEPINRSKVDQQLSINKFHSNYVADQRDPMSIRPELWATLLGRVSIKPTITYLFLQDGIPMLFA